MWVQAAMAAYGAYSNRRSVAGGGGEYANPSTATAGAYGSGLDGSQWNVNFGGSQVATSSKTTAADDTAPRTLPTMYADPGMGMPYVTAQAGFSPVMMLAVAGLLGVALWRSKRSGR